MDEQSRMNDMLSRYGEVCKRADAARILHVNPQTVNKMLADGRLEWACGGRMVDMRSIALYICKPAQMDSEARKRRYCEKHKTQYHV